MSKRNFVLLVAVVLSTMLVCLGGSVFAKVEIRAAWWGDTGRHELYNKIIDIFESKNPDIKVLREPTSWLDYWDKLTVQSAGGRAPDFMGMHLQFAADYLRRGIIEPLEQFVEKGIIDISDHVEGAIATGKVDGILYMVPMGITTQTILINNSILEELGVEAPNFDWTWNDVKTIGLKVRGAFDEKGEKDKWFIADSSGAYQVFRYWVRQRGREDLYTADGNIAYIAEDVATWFAMWNDLRKSGIIPDAATVTEYARATLEDNLFARRRVVGMGIPINQYRLYLNAMPETDLLPVRLPSLVDGLPGELVEGAHFAISAKTTPEKKVAAAKLINFWVNDPDSIRLFRLDQGVPSNRKMAEFLMTIMDEVDQKVIEYVNKTSAIARPTTFPPAGATEVNSLFEQIAEKVRFEQLTPEEAGEQLISQAQEILNRYK